MISARLRRAPTRIATGAFILNSGIGKLRTKDDDTAKNVHHMVANAYPVFDKVDSKVFLKSLGAAETALGAALLLPIVPPVAAGLALAGFSGALLGMYWRTPGMHQPGSPLPTEHGLPLAKDVWMAGIATSLILDSATTPAHEAKVRAKAEAKAQLKAAKAQTNARLTLAKAQAKGTRAELKGRGAALKGKAARMTAVPHAVTQLAKHMPGR